MFRKCYTGKTLYHRNKNTILKIATSQTREHSNLNLRRVRTIKDQAARGMPFESILFEAPAVCGDSAFISKNVIALEAITGECFPQITTDSSPAMLESISDRRGTVLLLFDGRCT